MKCRNEFCDKAVDSERPLGKRGPLRLYCSNQCKMGQFGPMAQRWQWVLESRDCERCNTLYTPSQIHQRFCSIKCQRKGHDERRRKDYVTSVERLCRHCLTSFTSVNFTQVYCRNKCRINAQTKKKRKKLAIKILDGTAQGGTKSRKDRNKKIVHDYKTSHGCTKCDESHPATLDFHHRDPKTKLANISKLVKSGYGVEILLAEIAKCDLLCANCHRKLEYKKRHGIAVERLAA